MNSILERIKKAYHLETDAEVADFLGINPSTLSMQKNRGRLNLELIIRKCPEINKNWLLHGQGPIRLSQSEDLIKIPVYSDLDIGNGGEVYCKEKAAVGWITTNKHILSLTESEIQSGHLLAYRVSEDPEPSVVGKYDIAIVDLAESSPDEGLFLVSTNGDVVCRQIDKKSDESTDEERISEEAIEKTNSQIIGKMVWLMRNVE